MVPLRACVSACVRLCVMCVCESGRLSHLSPLRVEWRFATMLHAWSVLQLLKHPRNVMRWTVRQVNTATFLIVTLGTLSMIIDWWIAARCLYVCVRVLLTVESRNFESRNVGAEVWGEFSDSEYYMRNNNVKIVLLCLIYKLWTVFRQTNCSLCFANEICNANDVRTGSNGSNCDPNRSHMRSKLAVWQPMQLFETNN